MPIDRYHGRSLAMMQELSLPTALTCCFICLFLGFCLLAYKEQLLDCIFSILRTSSVILINGCLIVVHPPELRFPEVDECEKLTSCSMELTNKTDRYVAFQVKTTKIMGAYAVPDKGVVLPKSRFIVTVTIQAPKDHISLEGSVIIQSIVVGDRTTIENVSSKKFDKAFAIVEEVKLKASYVFTTPRPRVLYESENKRSLRTSSKEDAEPRDVDSKGVESDKEEQNSGCRHEAPRQMILKPTATRTRTTTTTTMVKALNDKIRLLQADNDLLQDEYDVLEVERQRVQEWLREAINDRDEGARGFEDLRGRYRAVLEKLRKAEGEKLEAELRAADAEAVAKGLEPQFQTLRARCDALQRERDDAAREAVDLRGRLERDRRGDGGGVREAFRSEFSRSELVRATRNFHDSHKIGEGGFGSVYRARLRNTTVAIKVLRKHDSQGLSQFHQEEIVLSNVRHPNLVTLVGTCSEESFLALIYEYLPNGSLENCLRRCSTSNGGGGEMLPWRVRMRVVAEMCSALVFLHSVKPNPVVHGDLKPANVLLDKNMVSKLGDFGTARLLLEESDTGGAPWRYTQPKGTLHYVDPEFVSTGELTTQSDVYSLGIVILQLLTGKPALGVVRRVQEAMNVGHLRSVVDPSAGAWPSSQCKKLAQLALRCCQTNRRDRPDLAGEVCSAIEEMIESA